MDAERKQPLRGPGIMLREFAEVAVGGMPVGYAFVDVDESDDTVRLASPGLIASLLSRDGDEGSSAPCTCRTDELAPARLKSRSGAAWSLGVKVCMAHRCLRD